MISEDAKGRWHDFLTNQIFICPFPMPLLRRSHPSSPAHHRIIAGEWPLGSLANTSYGLI
jgi:hypothetical protein